MIGGQTLLTFDDVFDNDQTIGDPYRDLGIAFLANAWANPEDPVSVKNPPSPPNYLLLSPGSPITCNVSNGFTAINLHYVNGHTTAGQLRVYSGFNGAGSLLTSVSLPQTPITGGTTLQTWVQKSLSHANAHSFQISGVAQYLGVDNIRITGEFLPRIVGQYPSADLITASSATLHANVNPNGATTFVHFELDQDSNFPSPVTTPAQNIGSGTANMAVTQLASGLARGTFYYYRVVASNATGVVTSYTDWFTTLQTTVQTLSAGMVTYDSAVLKGAVNPQELSTDVYFQFGTNSSLTGATNTPVQNIGNGTTNNVFVAAMYGLKPGLYYYRAVATNSAGSQFGAVAGVSINCGYSATDNTTGTFTNISSTGTQVIGGGGIDDAISAAINIGFAFPFFGSDKTNLYLSSNGLLTFGSGSISGGNVDWSRSTSPGSDAIAVLWDDWETAAGVYAQTIGAPGQRVFVAQWNLRPYLGSGLVTFQVQLFEATSDILMYFSDANTDAEHTAGRTGSIGIRKNGAPGNGSYLMWSYNFETVYGGSMLRFSPQKPIVRSLFADNFTASEAILHAEVNPNYSPTTAHFEYGPTTSYGSVTIPIALPGTNAFSQPLTALASNLIAPGTYHFRVVASNSLGVIRSPNATFEFGVPYILQEPEDVAVAPRESAGLTVVAAGVPPLNYRWLFNGAEVSGATNATLNFPLALYSQAGNYQVVVSNAYGSATSTVAFLTISQQLTSVNSWQQRYSRAATGNDSPQAVTIAPSGNVIVTGNSRASNGSNDFLTISYTSAGVPVWTNRYNGPGNGDDEAASVVADAGGKIFVTGRSWSGANFDYATIAYAGAGTPLWTNRYNGSVNSYDYAEEVAVDGAGNVYVAGTSSGGNGDFLVIKYSNAGATVWTRRWDGDSTDLAYALALDASTNVYVAGRSYNGANYDYVTLKLSSTGTILWTNRYNGPGNDDDVPSDVEIGSSGAVIVTGSSYGSSGTTDFATVAYSSSGGSLWTNRYHGPGNGADAAECLAVDLSGKVFVTGSSVGTGGNTDYLSLAYSSTGTPLWTNRYSGTGADNAVGVRVNVLGQVMVAGYSSRGGTLLDFATVAYGNNGQPLGTNFFNGPGNGNDQPLTRQSLALTPDGLVVTGPTDSGAGNYDYATVKMYFGSAPQILTQPASQTNLIGTVAVLSVSADGSSPLAYQWRKNGVNLTNGGPITGANNSTLTLTGIQSADAGDYDVVVTNFLAAVTSSVATLTVLGPPVIASAPQSRTNVVGTLATVAVTASGELPLAYQWRKDGTNLTDTSNVSGAGTTMLSLANVSVGDAGLYDVVITNIYGSVTSAVASLTVVHVPLITSQPMSWTNLTGETASFSVTATGTGPLAYQWRKGAVDLNDAGNLTGATTPLLTMTNLAVTNAGSFVVVVSNPYGSVTSAVASLTVWESTLITNVAAWATSEVSGGEAWQLVDTIPGGYWESIGVGLLNIHGYGDDRDPAVTFDLNGRYQLDYFRFWNGPEDTDVKRMNVEFSLDGVNFQSFSEFSFPEKSPNDPPEIRDLDVPVARFIRFDMLENWPGQTFPVIGAPVANSFVGFSGVEFYGVYLAPAEPLVIVQPVSRTNYAGTAATFSALITGPSITYQWRKGGTPLVNGGNISGVTTTNLTLLNVQSGDAGAYVLFASNNFGMVTSQVATLTLQYFDTTGLLLYLPFDGDANDASGNGRHATVSGATLNTNRVGTAASAYYFGGGSLITVTNLDPDNYATGFSFGWWFKPFSGGGSPCYWLADAGWGSTYFIMPFYLRLGSGDPSTSYGLGGLTIPSGQWSHLFVTHDSNWNRLYLNGQKVWETASALPLAGNVSTLEMGRDGFVGEIDEFAVFGRGLSSNEVSLLYTGASLTAPPTAPPTSARFGLPLVSPSQVSLPVTGAAGALWNLQRAHALTGPWTNIGSVLIAPNGTGQFHDTNPPASGSFYRAMKP